MGEFLTLDHDKLDYASRLSGLLLNEGTDVLRWFLLDNLPRTLNARPDLEKLLKGRKEEFHDIVLDEFNCQKLCFTHEMFDILYPMDGFGIDVGNMEISLLYFLIRFMCQIKHPTWLWWDEDPEPHQQAPIFDVIRLLRFKERMQAIVHNYEITTDIFEKSFKHVIQIIDRLRGYKLSARRWKSDVIAYPAEERLRKEKKPLTLLSIMRWQTLAVKERNETYLVLKENYLTFEANKGGNWCDFISHFGQMQNLEICEINSIDNNEDEARDLVYPANDPANKSYLPTLNDNAKALNWEFVMDAIWKRSSSGNLKVKVGKKQNSGYYPKCLDELTPKERAIYKSIDDSVFVDDPPGTSAQSKIQRLWKEKAIRKYSNITVFPYKESDLIPMDNVKFNIREDSATFDCWSDVLIASEQSAGQSLRVRLLGPSSIGKTTFLQKICYHCATKDCPQLSAYDVVVYIDLASIHVEKPYVRLVDCIKRQLLDEDDSKTETSADDIESVMATRKGQGVLLLLDNIDELSISEEYYEIWDLITGNIWPQCGIITTSKPGCYARMNDDSRVALQNIKGYRICCIEGFKNIDVRNEVQRYFKAARVAFTKGERVTMSRHICNLLRIYHRDVYEGYYCSPVLCSILCTAFLRCIESNGLSNKPISMEEAFGEIFQGFLGTLDISSNEFGQAALESLLHCENMRWTSDHGDQLQKLLSIGIIKKPYLDDVVHFTHPLLKDFLSARVFCECHDVVSLRLWVGGSDDALRLQHFLIFCCTNKTMTEGILHILCNLLVSECLSEHKEKLVTLCLRCFNTFYKDNSDWHEEHCKITKNLERTNNDVVDEGESDLVYASLDLTAPHELSHTARESFLTFVTACKPGLTQSGTIFPLLRTIDHVRQTSCIRELTISNIRPRVANFVALIVEQLPFLSSLSLKDILAESSKDFKVIRDSLMPSSPKVISVLHALDISFRCETRFDMNKLPQYDIIAPIFRKLTFLEKFNIHPLTCQNFISLFDEIDTIVPIERVDLSNNEVSDDRCATLSKLLSRSIFLRFLNLSHNPIYNGLSRFLQTFTNFRILQVLQLEECCLSSDSVAALAASFKVASLKNTLHVLALMGNHLDDQESLLELTNSIGNLQQLRKLDLSRNFLGDRVICVLASQLLKTKHIQYLKLNYVKMGKLGFSALRSSVSVLENLEYLSIGENPLPPDALTIISDWTVPNCKMKDTITELTVSGVSADLPLQVTKNGARKTAFSIARLPRLRRLNMIHTVLSHPDVMVILEAVENHPAMEQITLSKSLSSFNEAERNVWRRLLLT